MTSGDAEGEGGEIWAPAAPICGGALRIQVRQGMRGRRWFEESSRREEDNEPKGGRGPSSREVWSIDAARGRRQREKRGARKIPLYFSSL
jgi:hypothetical protein